MSKETNNYHNGRVNTSRSSFLNRVSLCNSNWPYIHGNPPSSASQALESQVFAITPNSSLKTREQIKAPFGNTSIKMRKSLNIKSGTAGCGGADI